MSSSVRRPTESPRGSRATGYSFGMPRLRPVRWRRHSPACAIPQPNLSNHSLMLRRLNHPPQHLNGECRAPGESAGPPSVGISYLLPCNAVSP
ncbi:hypothetical protein FKM82_029049 [Ascaphus truei]